ncbi:hypothetical protein ACEXQD_00055 [Herbiconiux sp. P15]|uniref:hypothetical protein n=1 Tax=Herbiconiux liukaitaii TaxID=3342799 RepID=UPI0035BA093D
MALGRLVNSILHGAPAPTGQVRQEGEPELTPADRPSRPPANETDDERTARELDELRALERRSGRELPGIVSSRLRQIDDVLRVVVATIAAQDASTEQRVLLEAMITDYIATPLHAFLALPAPDRAEASRATELFARQLELIEETIHDLLNQIRIGAIAELSTHGRFLADKFQTPDEGLVLGGS